MPKSENAKRPGRLAGRRNEWKRTRLLWVLLHNSWNLMCSLYVLKRDRGYIYLEHWQKKRTNDLEEEIILPEAHRSYFLF